MQFVKSHPRTFNGKVVKYLLREETGGENGPLGDTTTKDGTYAGIIEQSQYGKTHIVVRAQAAAPC